MRAEAVTEAAHAHPFKPFTIHLADGRSAHVPAPDFVSVHPNKRLIVVMTQGGVRLIDLPLITEIAFEE